MDTREIPFVVCDVFTDTPLQGNQLGVFPDARWLSSSLMQRLTRELNFSESAFVLPAGHGGDFRVRIFTPVHEVPFAGHPTLGTAWVLADARGLNELTLETGSGLIPLRFEREGGRLVLGRMKQPVPTVRPFDREDELLAALGLARSQLPVELYDNGIEHVYVALGTEDEVAALRPDPAGLMPFREVGINCFAASGASWKTRMFFFAIGLVEDAATGSAAGPLALHLARHGRIRWGEEIEIRQGEEIGRPSRLLARVEGGPGGIEAVEVSGSAAIVARGHFHVQDQSERGSRRPIR